MQDPQPVAVADNPSLDRVEIEDIAPPLQKNRLWIVRTLSVIIVLSTWEVLGRQVDPLFMSYPTAIAVAASSMIASGELLSGLLASLHTLIYAFTIATVIGITVGMLIGRYKIVDVSTDWLVSALYTTPQVAIIPLVILWFGLGSTAKIFIVTVSAVFPILINTTVGVRNVPTQLIDVGTAFAANERQIFTAITGLGAIIVKYGNQYDTASMFVPIFVLMFLGVMLSGLLRRAEEWI